MPGRYPDGDDKSVVGDRGLSSEDRTEMEIYGNHSHIYRWHKKLWEWMRSRRERLEGKEKKPTGASLE